MKIASIIFPDIPNGPIYNPAGGKYGAQNAVGSVVLTDIIANILTSAFAIAAILLLVFIVLGGVQWILSGGEKQGVENAKNRITNAIIGLIIVALAIAIVMFIGSFLDVNLLKPKLPIPGV